MGLQIIKVCLDVFCARNAGLIYPTCKHDLPMGEYPCVVI